MASRPLVIRFPNGIVKYGVFNDTSDRAWAKLFDRSDLLEDQDADLGTQCRAAEATDEHEKVVVSTDYCSWEAVATRDILLEPLDLGELEEEEEDAEDREGRIFDVPGWAHEHIDQWWAGWRR